MTLLLFTTSYPYDYAAEYMFIQPELPYLVEKFKRVILVPRLCNGSVLSIPSGMEVNDGYAVSLRQNANPLKMLSMARAFGCFSRELRRYPGLLLYPSKILKLVLFSGRAELTRRWLKDFLKTQQLDPGDCFLYSYWFDHMAAGLARLKQEFPNIKLISRAHGFDIYEEYYYPYYWPCRHETLAVLDKLFFSSEAGKAYFREHYPEYLPKFETAHLGITDPGFRNQPSSDGVFRIVSCALIVPVKRLELLLDGIAAAARLRPEQQFEWVHLGDGKGREALERRMTRSFPINARGRFLGKLPNTDILRYYKDHPVDVFVNVSSTEGGAPVAIQEAISCGIPVIATTVGGNPEVVSKENGILISSDPSPEEIAKAILVFLDHPEKTAARREASRALWRKGYNAEVNFRAFAERLQTIGEN